MVIVIYFFDKNEKLILLGTLFLIIIFSLDSLQFQSLLQDYYDTDNYDYQEPVWIDLINNKSNIIWNERIGSGHRLVGQIPREYIIFKIVASEIFSVFNSYNFYVIFHYLSSALILLQVSKKLNFNKFIGAIFVYALLSAELLSSWYSFIHWPGFVFGLSLIFLALLSSDFKKVIYLSIGSYCLSTSAHLQLYLMIYIFLGIYFLVDLLNNKNLKVFTKNLSYLFVASVFNFVYLFYFFETLSISDRSFVGGVIDIPKLNIITVRTILDPFTITIEHWLRLNNNLYVTPLFLFLIFVFKANNKQIKNILYASLATAFLFSELNFFSEFFQQIIFINYVSNWERFSSILVFSLAIIIFAGIDKFYKDYFSQSKQFLLLILLISLFSGMERQNVLHALELKFSSDKESEFVELIEMTDSSYKISGVCFAPPANRDVVSDPYDYEYVYRPNRFLSYDSTSRWFDIYDSWVIKGYSEYFDQLTSDIGSGIKYGGGWFHSSVGSKFNISLAKKANIGFVITPKNQNCINTEDVELVKSTDNLNLYKIPDAKKRYYFTDAVFESKDYSYFLIYDFLMNGFTSIEDPYNIEIGTSKPYKEGGLTSKPPSVISTKFNVDGANIINLNNKRYALFEKDLQFYSAGSNEEFNKLIELMYNPIGYNHPVFQKFESNFLGDNNQIEYTTFDDGVYTETPSAIELFSNSQQNISDPIVEYDLFRNGYFHLEVETFEPTLLVFNETWDPGWILTVNGIEKEIYLANRAYMGAILETGNNVIEFKYKNFDFRRISKSLVNFFN